MKPEKSGNLNDIWSKDVIMGELSAEGLFGERFAAKAGTEVGYRKSESLHSRMNPYHFEFWNQYLDFQDAALTMVVQIKFATTGR